MRITLVEPDGSGGLAHFAYELSEALARRGHSVRLITSTDCELARLPRRFALEPVMRLWPKTAAPASRSPGLRTFLRRAGRAFRLTREWAKATRQILAERPDFVLFSEILFPHLALFLWILRRRDIRLGQICHEFNYQEREGGGPLGAAIHRALSSRIYRQFDHVAFLSESARTDFVGRFGYPATSTARIRHGSQSVFPPPRRSPEEFRRHLGLGSEPVILFFGGIRTSKGLPDLIRAFARSRWRSRAKLVIAGQPTKYAGMEEIGTLLDETRLRDRVVMQAAYIPMEDVAGYFQIARCVVLPYRSATQSGVAHLAYHHARPVVATAVGGLAEDVIDGETGLLVPPASIGELAAAIDRLLDDGDLAARMGDRARELSRTRFSWDEAASILEAAIAGIAGGARDGPPPRSSPAGDARAHSPA